MLPLVPLCLTTAGGPHRARLCYELADSALFERPSDGLHSVAFSPPPQRSKFQPGPRARNTVSISLPLYF